MTQDERFLYYRDENGRRRDDAVHEPFLADPDTELWFQLSVIRQHVESGNSLEDAVALLGTEAVRELHDAGRLPAILDELP